MLLNDSPLNAHAINATGPIALALSATQATAASVIRNVWRVLLLTATQAASTALVKAISINLLATSAATASMVGGFLRVVRSVFSSMLEGFNRLTASSADFRSSAAASFTRTTYVGRD